MLSLFSFRSVLMAAVILGSALPPVLAATTESLTRLGHDVPENSASRWYEDEPVTTPLSKLLPPGTATPPSGFFTEIPPDLDPAVRRIMSEDYTAAEVLLAAEVDKAKSDRE